MKAKAWENKKGWSVGDHTVEKMPGGRLLAKAIFGGEVSLELVVNGKMSPEDAVLLCLQKGCPPGTEVPENWAECNGKAK